MQANSQIQRNATVLAVIRQEIDDLGLLIRIGAQYVDQTELDRLGQSLNDRKSRLMTLEGAMMCPGKAVHAKYQKGNSMAKTMRRNDGVAARQLLGKSPTGTSNGKAQTAGPQRSV